jgi:hypothetical protein
MEVALVDRQFRYVLVFRRGRLVGAAVCTLERRFEHPTLQRRGGWLARVLPSLRCGVPIAYEAGLLAESGEVPTVIDAVRRLAWRERALLVTIGNLSTTAWDGLARAGCRPLSRWTGATLEVRWPTFAAYVASRPRDDRHEIGRMQRRAERDGISVGREPLDAADAQLARQLMQNVLDRHQSADGFAADLLERTMALLGDDVHVIAARQAGRLIGCSVVLRDQDEAIAKWLGLDYTRTWNTATYHMLLRQSVAEAIEMGVKRLRLGATAYSTKAQFGVEPDERVNALVLPPWRFSPSRAAVAVASASARGAQPELPR